MYGYNPIQTPCKHLVFLIFYPNAIFHYQVISRARQVNHLLRQEQQERSYG